MLTASMPSAASGAETARSVILHYHASLSEIKRRALDRHRQHAMNRRVAPTVLVVTRPELVYRGDPEVSASVDPVIRLTKQTTSKVTS